MHQIILIILKSCDSYNLEIELLLSRLSNQLVHESRAYLQCTMIGQDLPLYDLLTFRRNSSSALMELGIPLLGQARK